MFGLVAWPSWARSLSTRLLGSSRERDGGEAATLAWAETHDAIALIDERAARRRKVAHHGTLWLVARGLARRSVSPAACSSWRCYWAAAPGSPSAAADEFIPWARDEGLLGRDAAWH